MGEVKLQSHWFMMPCAKGFANIGKQQNPIPNQSHWFINVGNGKHCMRLMNHNEVNICCYPKCQSMFEASAKIVHDSIVYFGTTLIKRCNILWVNAIKLPICLPTNCKSVVFVFALDTHTHTHKLHRRSIVSDREIRAEADVQNKIKEANQFFIKSHFKRNWKSAFHSTDER